MLKIEWSLVKELHLQSLHTKCYRYGEYFIILLHPILDRNKQASVSKWLYFFSSKFFFQAYDWLHLNQDFGCRFQIGGNDQLGNIHAGYDLITKVTNQKVYGLTVPLMKTKEGDKFGKSRRNALWLSHKATSPFEFYQYFMRSEDSDLENLLLAYTFEPIQNIKDVMNAYWKKPEEKLAQKMLAHNVTLLVHGGKKFV